jgi:ABC-type multidrug transport system fused ATPase/permease subunit
LCFTEDVVKNFRQTAEWRFFGAMNRADATLSIAWWALIAVRGALPALFTLAMGALVGAVENVQPIAGALAFAGLVFIAIHVLGPVQEALSSALGAKTSTWLLDHLMTATTAPPGLAHLERPDLADELAVARQFDQGMTGPDTATAMPHIASGFSEIVSGFGQAIVLAGYRWWAPLLVGGAWLSTHFLLRESSVWKIWRDPHVVDAQRHADYAYRLAVNAPAAKEIRLFGLADWTVGQFAARRTWMANALLEARRLHQGPLWRSLLLIGGSNALLFWFLAHDANAGTLSLAAVVVFAQAALGTSALAFGEVDWWFRQTAQPIPKVLDLADTMAPAGALRVGSRPAVELPKEAIRFEHVRFTYPSHPRAVLDGFDLTIPAGTSLAIVGQNGAGKTTLAKLICRLYDPDAGAVTVDGIDLRDIDITGWRRRVAAVFQDFIRYELPLRDNVAPAGASDDAVRKALELARAADLAELDTILSRGYAGGTDLSGGQWQRVALARALCAVHCGAGVVILDEPTAQLDVRGEAQIFDAILAATRGCTTILISHRFSTVRHADRICVLEAGRVVELGTHDELMALGGRYKTMFELQASRFWIESDEEAVHAGVRA